MPLITVIGKPHLVKKINLIKVFLSIVKTKQYFAVFKQSDSRFTFKKLQDRINIVLLYILRDVAPTYYNMRWPALLYQNTRPPLGHNRLAP